MTHSSQLPKSVIQLAQQGNPNAIAAFMNSKLEAAHIKAVVRLKDECLQILLEANKVLNKPQCLAFVAQVVTRLQLRSRTSIKAIAVYGRRSGESNLLWQHKQLLTAPRTATKVSPVQPLTQTPAGERAAIQSSNSQPVDEFMTIESLAIAFSEWEQNHHSQQGGQSTQAVQDKPRITTLKQAQSAATDITVDAVFAYFN